MMNGYDIRQKHVLVLGLGSSGVAAALLAAGSGAVVSATDIKKADELGSSVSELEAAGVNLYLGRHPEEIFRNADVVVVRFGDKYRQWNAAFDAGYAVACGTPVITLHDPELTHALKEVDGAALAVAESPEQVVQIMRYVIEGVLPAPD